MQFAAEYIGKNYAAFASDHNVLVEANINCAEDFQFDQLSAISDPYRETQGFGARIEYQTNAVPKCIDPPLEKSRDLSLLQKPDSNLSERMADRINAIRKYSDLHRYDYSIMGWIEGPAAEAADLRTLNNFYMDLLNEPAFAEELMDICVEVAINFAAAQLNAGADTIGIGDAIASQVSTHIYEKMILPREKKIVQAIKESGGLVRLHICGNITHLLNGIADLNVDILDVDHMVDMRTVRDIIGDNVVLAGNIDPVQGIKFGSPESIQSKVVEIYEQAGNPYMVNAGCEIPSGTPIENLKAFCEPLIYNE
jgi:MtaA/CmuA family methyltransferase